MAQDWKLCSRKCGRPIDMTNKFKTCCRSCALHNGFSTDHNPICDVRWHEYKQLNSIIPSNIDEQKTDDIPWRCVLCNWSNKSILDQCTMCNKERPGQKRKRDSDSCPDSASPFHVCGQKCVDRWGVIQSIAPPTKKQKIENNNNINIDNSTHEILMDDQTWKCSLCTFVNTGISLQCNVCQTEKHAQDEIVLKQLKSQRDELQKNKSVPATVSEENQKHDEIELLINSNESKENTNKKRNTSNKEEMDSDDEIEQKTQTTETNVNDDLSEHESDDDVALEMFKNGLTPHMVQSSQMNKKTTTSKYMTVNNNGNKEILNHNINMNSNKEHDLLFSLSVSDYLEQSGFTYIVNDCDDRYIADIVAESALNEEEYWDAHNIANTIPWVDPGDDLDNLIHGFDHGTMAKTVNTAVKGKGHKIKYAGYGGNGIDNGHDDDEIDENSVERVNIQREFQYAMQTGKIVRCRLIRRRQFDEHDDGDAQFRICESQFMRSCNRSGVLSNGMQRTLKEVIYVINPGLIKKFQAKKKKMKYRLGSGGTNTILAWHGTPSKNIDSIVDDNFSISHLSKNSGDTGWYGAGIYFSEYANISQGYGDGLLLCKIMLGKTYKMRNIKVGCEQKKGYDSHMADSGNSKYGTEIVIFDMDQILPCYIVKY